MNEKKIFTNKKNMQMSIALPKIKSPKATLRFTNEKFIAVVKLVKRREKK